MQVDIQSSVEAVDPMGMRTWMADDTQREVEHAVGHAVPLARQPDLRLFFFCSYHRSTNS